MKKYISICLLGLSCLNSTYVISDELIDADDLSEFNDLSIPVVLTATRIQQPQADVPASVTILDAELIKKLGVQSLSDLLRFVPGMMVAPDQNNNADAVHYHGGPLALPKNLQVLINGRSMYRVGLAAVSWFEMPVALEDISRIEVVRGPNSASYGANAYQAVINILTKHPADTHGSSVSIKGGNNGEKNLYLKQGGTMGPADYRLSVTQRSNDGFEGLDDRRIARFIDLETHQSLSGMGELETSLIYLQAKKGIAEPIPYQTNDNDVEETRMEAGFRWTMDLSEKHQLQVKSYITQYNQRQKFNVAGVQVAYLDDDLRELFRLNPVAAEAIAGGADPSSLLQTQAEVDLATAVIGRYPGATGLTPVSGHIDADLDEYRFDIEIQDTFIYSDDLTLVSGASFRRDNVDSKPYFNGDVTSDISRLFGSMTWSATDRLNVHLGLMAEQESHLDLVFAPRAALNYKFSPVQSMRLVYSESVRSPDAFEQYADWSFNVKRAESTATLNGTTFYQTQLGPGELDHQRIESWELGYYGRLGLLDSELDIRLFREQLSDVIYQSLTLADFKTSEGNKIRFEGVEWMLDFKPWDHGRIRWAAAYVDVVAESDKDNVSRSLLRVYAEKTSTISWLQSWSPRFNTSLSYILADKMDQYGEHEGDGDLLERIDGHVGKRFDLGSYDLELDVSVQHDLSSDPYVVSNHVYKNETRYQLGLRLDF